MFVGSAQSNVSDVPTSHSLVAVRDGQVPFPVRSNGRPSRHREMPHHWMDHMLEWVWCGDASWCDVRSAPFHHACSMDWGWMCLGLPLHHFVCIAGILFWGFIIRKFSIQWHRLFLIQHRPHFPALWGACKLNFRVEWMVSLLGCSRQQVPLLFGHWIT